MSFAFDLTILGSNSSYPSNGRMSTSQILSANRHLYMIDCGEGTQLQLTKYGISRNKIKAIFISHFHGDHLYGLPGLLTSYMHFDRKTPLSIYGPFGLKKYLNTVFEISEVHLQFPLDIVETDWKTSSVIYEDESIIVKNFPMIHRIPTQGFTITNKISSLNIIPEKIVEYGLNHLQIKELKNNQAVTLENGKKITPQMTCFPAEASKKYVYMSDTSPIEELDDCILDCDLLYHESTYLNEMAELAINRGHSTAVHAAQTAIKANAKSLLLGHFSSRYLSLDLFLEQSTTIFPNTRLAIDGDTYPIGQ